MTMILVRYKGNGQFTFSGGGHTEIVVYRSLSGTYETIDAGGIYLCIEEDISEYVTARDFKLSPGDILFLYTDGIIESRKFEGGELWVMGRFLDSVSRNVLYKDVEKIRQEILREASEWCGNNLKDDMTLMVVRRKT